MTDMQDRIKELAIEAGFGIGHSEAAATLFERFAQAIARECAEICQRRYEMCSEPEARELAGEISDTFGITKE